MLAAARAARSTAAAADRELRLGGRRTRAPDGPIAMTRQKYVPFGSVPDAPVTLPMTH